MLNSSFEAQSASSVSPMPMFCQWEVPDRALRLQLKLDLVDRLESEVVERFKAITTRGSEIGGVLLGRIGQEGANRIVTIEQCELVLCEYSRGSLYLLSDGDRQRLRQTVDRYGKAIEGFTVVGFFRSNTRRDLVVDDEDLDILKELFASPDCVFLLVKPFASKPSIAAFFLWKDGEVQDEPQVQFPFRRSELLSRAGSGPAPAAQRQAPQAEPRVPYPGGEPPVKLYEPAPAPADEMAGRSIRILNPYLPVLLVDSRMRAEWELAAAVRSGKFKEYVLRYRQYFCKHPNLLWIENVSEGDPTAPHFRSVWQCTECHATVHREEKQPYACEQAGETARTAPSDRPAEKPGSSDGGGE